MMVLTYFLEWSFSISLSSFKVLGLVKNSFLVKNLLAYRNSVIFEILTIQHISKSTQDDRDTFDIKFLYSGKIPMQQ